MGLLAFFALILFLSYSNTFHAAWQLDDQPNILANTRLHITSLAPNQLYQSMTAKPGSGGLYRPVACLTLALNWLYGRHDVFGYHVVNFLIHLATAWGLFLVSQTLFRTPRLKSEYNLQQRLFMAAAASLMWALNPVQTQAVTYVVQRMASLAAFFAVLSIYFYLKARLTDKGPKQYWLYMVALILYFLGFFSKENVILLPLAVPVLEWLFFPANRARLMGRKRFAGVTLAVVMGSLIAIILQPDSIDFIINFYDNRPFSLTERLLTEQRILLFYLSLLFFPIPGRLSIEHDITISASLFSPWTTAAAVAVNAMLVIFALKLGRKQPLIALAVLFFYLNHIVESTFLPLELVFEHRNYLPSIFLFLPVAQGFGALMKRSGHNNALRLTVSMLVVAILSLEGYATYARNRVWKTEQSLWLDAHAKAPESARPLSRLAVLLAWGENPTPAKYKKALELSKRALSSRMHRNERADLLGNMASIYDKLDQPQSAREYYEKALIIAPRHAQNRFNYVKMLIGEGQFLKARSELEILLEQGWEHADYYYLVGFVDLWIGEYARALPMLQRGLGMAPRRPDILLAVGNCLSSLGQYQKAHDYFIQAETYGGKALVVSLNIIQNALSAGNETLARASRDEMLARFPVSQVRGMLEFSENNYKIVPLEYARLNRFLSSEIQDPN